MITLSDVEAAAARIGPHVRRTPLLRATALRRPVTPAGLWLKLECAQPTGSFKVRGATNKLMTTAPERIRAGIVTASGGNHGLATARAAALAGVAATVFVPTAVSPDKLRKLEDWNADIRIVGRMWDESHREALAFAEATGAAYFHPFADPAVVAGQGTVALEILRDLPDLDVLLVAIGGGGLIAGIATVIKALKPSVRIFGIEAAGAPTLRASLEAGEVVTLPTITTGVATLACARTDERIYAMVRGGVEGIVLVSDADMLEAARWLWAEMGIAADLSGAAGLAALQTGALRFEADTRVCTLVCGSGREGLS